MRLKLTYKMRGKGWRKSNNRSIIIWVLEVDNSGKLFAYLSVYFPWLSSGPMWSLLFWFRNRFALYFKARIKNDEGEEGWVVAEDGYSYFGSDISPPFVFGDSSHRQRYCLVVSAFGDSLADAWLVGNHYFNCVGADCCLNHSSSFLHWSSQNQDSILCKSSYRSPDKSLLDSGLSDSEVSWLFDGWGAWWKDST